MKKNKGFTLIELLAVIVILAIIAVIAVPIVLNIVSEAEVSAATTSAKNYVRALENNLSSGMMTGKKIPNGAYYVTDEGNICLGMYFERENKCYADEFKVDISGGIPTSGVVTFYDGAVHDVKFYYDEVKVTIDKDKESITLNLEDENASEKKLIDYEIGQPVIYDPGYGQDVMWNVIDEDKTTVTLLLSENMAPTKTPWISKRDYDLANTDGTKCDSSTGCTDEGPITIFNFLNSLTSDFDIEPIDDYTYINLQTTAEDETYQRIEIKKGVTKITDSKGNINTINGITKTRLLTMEEFINILEIYNPDFSLQSILNWYEDNEDIWAKEEENDLKTVEQFIEAINQMSPGTITLQTYTAMFTGILTSIAYGVPMNYTHPNFLASDLNGLFTIEYLMLTAPDNTMSDNYVRPVITIQKSKLK